MTPSTTPSETLPELLRQSSANYGDHPAIHFAGRTTTHREFGAATDRVAAGLASLGFSPGDRIGLYCANSDAFPIAYFGILKAGCTVVPANLLLNPKEVAYIYRDAAVKAVIYLDLLGKAVAGFRAELPPDIRYLCIGNAPLDPADTSFLSLLATPGDPPQLSLDPAQAIAVILYTSGTTGYPKGAMLTHRNLAANASSISEALQLEAGKDILLTVLPMFHAFAATVCMVYPLLNGCTIVPLPKFDPQQVADAIAAHRVTFFAAVPSMYGSLLKLPETEIPKFQSLRVCVSGGAAMPIELMNQFEAKFGKEIYEGDGPTECSPCTCVNPIGGPRKIGSVGQVIPRVEMKILDDHANELPTGEVGEICVRGPNVMKGYWNQPEETAASFFGEWFRTGDLGKVDEDGYFYILDRIKDMIIVNGMNVYPRVIEEVLYKHPAIREAAVVGQPDSVHGEKVIAHVVLHEGQTLDAPAVRAYCREHLGRHEIPRDIRFLPQLPRNAGGKVLKRELRLHGEHERGVGQSPTP
ncbi:MAG TPA: long-chain fatty acid--CoA ligase [Kiritimatiellia bacterium]|nr:long-chain fatty acid--CoA ligase [Kiritimatiellia bacterium]